MVKIKKGSKPYILLFPALAIILLFKVYPIVFSVYKSFLKPPRAELRFSAGLKTTPSFLAWNPFGKQLPSH